MREEDERAFRATAGTLLVSVLSVSAYHRRKADLSGGGVSWREEGLPMIVTLRASGLAMWLSVIAYLINPNLMRWSSVDLPAALRWSGATLGVATVPCSYWVFSSIDKNITPTVSTRKDHKLVTSGPYRWVRHPLYSVGTTFFASLSVLAANWFMALTNFAVFLMLVVRLSKEEEKLIERFGEEYHEYMKRTGRFFPRLKI